MDEEAVSRLPDDNNVYGIVRAADGLKAVLRIAQAIVGHNRASAYVSGYSGAETLRFSNEQCDFESDPLGENDEHLLNGRVAGSLPDVAQFVGALAQQLTEAGFANHFEVYDDELVKVIGE